MTGATMADNPSLHRLKQRYCVLQYQKATIEDQQYLLVVEMRKIGMVIIKSKSPVKTRRRKDGIKCPKCGRGSVDWRSLSRDFRCKYKDCRTVFTRNDIEVSKQGEYGSIIQNHI